MQKKLVIFTGAGVSQASGLGTFRDGPDGLWAKYDLNVVCNYNTFLQNRDKVFDFYNLRKSHYLTTKPNPAHDTLAKLQKQFNAQLFTSNVDCLHEAAGSTNVYHVHGRFDEMNCFSCDHRWHIGDALFDTDVTCPMCGGVAKPGIVLFGESAPVYADLGKAVQDHNTVKIILGASLTVVNPYQLGCNYGRSIYVDPSASEFENEYFDVCIAKKAEEVTAEELSEVVLRLMENM